MELDGEKIHHITTIRNAGWGNARSRLGIVSRPRPEWD